MTCQPISDPKHGHFKWPLHDEQITYIESKHLMKLLEQLNDIEIIWLRYFLHSGGDASFYQQHKEVLENKLAIIGATHEEIAKAELQESFTEHLVQLGLLRHHYRKDKDLGIPEFDKQTGKQKVSYSEATGLGRMLLKHVGLLD